MEGSSKRGREEDEEDDSNNILSKLPEPILQHILCFLSQKDAVKTCVLSKAWRRLWCARPKIHFSECCTVPGANTDAFLSVVDAALHTHHGLQDITLQFSTPGDAAVEFLSRWIPTLFRKNTVLKKFDLAFYLTYWRRFELQAMVLESESIRDLSLCGCVLKSPEPATAQCLKNLRKLRLVDVCVSDELLDNMLSNCAFIEDAHIANCKGFARVRLLNDNQKPTNLRRVHLGSYSYSNSDISVEISRSIIQNLVNVDIAGVLLSVNCNGQLDFARLKSLILTRVRLLSCDLFSCTSFPCLDELKLERCQGIEDLNLLCCTSMKHLTITNINRPFMAFVDAPSIVSFRYEGILPQSISFAAASDHGWKSNISLRSFEGISNEPSTCFNEITGLLKALSRSEISLALDENMIHWLRNPLHNEQDKSTNNIVGVSEAKLPVVVEHLRVEESVESLHSSSEDFLNSVFHIFRPRFLYMDLFTNPKTEFQQVAEILLEEKGMAQCYFWQHVLEGVSIQGASYTDESEWRPVQYTNFKEFSNQGAVRRVRLHLKWRDLS